MYRNFKRKLAPDQEWKPISLALVMCKRTVHKHLDQPIDSQGRRFCCNCKNEAPLQEAWVEGQVTSSVLAVFCSDQCASIRALLRRAGQSYRHCTAASADAHGDL
jgi:hypothetical protein